MYSLAPEHLALVETDNTATAVACTLHLRPQVHNSSAGSFLQMCCALCASKAQRRLVMCSVLTVMAPTNICRWLAEVVILKAFGFLENNGEREPKKE